MTVDLELQAELDELKTSGVELLACKACADRYGVSDKLAGGSMSFTWASP